MFTDYNEFFMMDGDATVIPGSALPSSIPAAVGVPQQRQTQQLKPEAEIAFATTAFGYGAPPPMQGHWDPAAMSLEALTETSHITVSPAEFMSAASTASSCFSELDDSPLIEDLDLCGEASWTSLFDDQVPAIPASASSITAAPPVPLFTANSDTALSGSPLLQGGSSTQKRAPTNPPPAKTIRRSEAVSQSSPKGPMTFAEALAEEVNKKLKRDHDRFAVGPTGNKIDEHGVTVYKRKPRAAPLRPIPVPEGDTVASKRARNTESARKSRARKMERMVQLEDLVSDLTQEKQDLEAEVARLKKLCGEA